MKISQNFNPTHRSKGRSKNQASQLQELCLEQRDCIHTEKRAKLMGEVKQTG